MDPKIAPLKDGPECGSARNEKPMVRPQAEIPQVEWTPDSTFTCLSNDLPVEAYYAIIAHATTDDSVLWISHSIDKILKDNEPAKKMFGTPTFLEKFKMMEKYARSDDAKYSFRNVIDLLQPIVDYQRFFQSLRDASSSIELKAAIDVLPSLQVCFTAEIPNAIIQKRILIADAPTADTVVSFLKKFSDEYGKRHLLCTAEIQDLIIDVLAPKISGGDLVE